MDISVINIVSIITLVLVVFSFINEKWLKLPPEIGMMTIAFSLSLALLTLQHVGIQFVSTAVQVANIFNIHDIIMNGLICFLLFSGSARIKFRDLTDDKYLILSLSFFSTLIAAVAYGVAVYFLAAMIGLPLTLIQGFMLGSIIAPTDPVSAMSILKQAGISHRVSMIMEGESLFNDGIGVALFVTFSAINQHTGSESVWLTFIETIGLSVVGALVIGLIVSLVLFALFKRTEHKHVEVLISISAVTSAYSLSEHFGASAPIAAVVVGIYFATMMHRLHDDFESYYAKFYAFWKVVDKALNGMLYIIIGFAILYLHSTPYFLVTMIGAIVIGLASRWVSLLIPIQLFSRQSSIQPRDYRGERRQKDVSAMIKLLTWGGLKGGISVALVLGTRHVLSSSHYNFFVICTYAVVAFSILVQGLTIQVLYQRIKSQFA